MLWLASSGVPAGVEVPRLAAGELAGPQAERIIANTATIKKILFISTFLSKNLKKSFHLFRLNNTARLIWGDFSHPLLTQN
jgi:hypothetical protein